MPVTRLSFRPEPERTRRRSGGTCFPLPLTMLQEERKLRVAPQTQPLCQRSHLSPVLLHPRISQGENYDDDI